MEEEFKQKNGDILVILRSAEKKDYVYCYSKVYKNTFVAKRYHVKNGGVLNPEIENLNFIGKVFPQNCGDDLLIVEKTKEKDKDNSFLFRCRFLKYPYEFLSSQKSRILKGNVENPLIEIEEFVNKQWPQKCGDILEIIKKEAPRKWRCRFLKYPYEVICEKSKVLQGCVDNPQMREREFVGKEIKQNCGCYLRILEKSSRISNSGSILYKCKFIGEEEILYLEKGNILKGNVSNPALPWKTKENLKRYLKEKFLGKKPTLTELAKDLNISISTIGHKINEYELRSYIDYSFSCQEKEVFSFLKELGVQCDSKLFNLNDKKEGGFYRELDAYLPKFNLGIEFNGNHWHSNLYKEPNYHQEKTLLFYEQLGIDVIHIFEYEWQNKQEIIQSLIKARIGIFDQKIGARKCEIKEISTKEYQEFCNQNHLQGQAGAKVKIGLFYKKELVQIMSFGVPRFTNNYDWEIIRECSKLGYFILGGKQRIWKYFVEKYNPKNCISYCDFSKFLGKSYIQLGFKKERLNKPGFVWFDESTKETFWRTPIKNQEYKEKYLKIYDCGQLVFTWQKD